MMRGPDGNLLEVVPVEKNTGDAWAGVAAVDDGSEGTDWSKVGKLAGGDAAALLLFAVIGRLRHGEVLSVETIGTVLPFWIGWFTAAALLGGFGKDAQTGSVQQAAIVAAKCWAIGMPIALVLRSISKGYIPDASFFAVSFGATLVLLVGWRAALASTYKPEAPLSNAAKVAKRKDKRGNPFEFFQLLFSLVKRW